MGSLKIRNWLDISVPLKHNMVTWPGDPPVKIRKMLDLKQGDPCTVRMLSFGSHTGTHMDAPGHFLKHAASLDGLPFDVVIGPARVIAVKNKISITSEELAPHKIRRGERILFKTINSCRCWTRAAFVKDFVYISEPAAHMLAKLKVKLVGVDYLSVGGFKADGVAIHRTLLKAGIWIIEGLNLSKARPGNHDMLCLPLKLHDGDGAPARVILRSRRKSHISR